MDRPIRLLVADDSARSRQGLRALLATWPGARVVGEAADGAEAVRLARELLPDVVVMDARMPVMDGLEATRKIKSAWPKVRVVMLTLYNSFRAEALAAGVDAFLVKGGPVEQLLVAIGETEARIGEG